MDPSGLVEARIGASPHGQGLETTVAQIVADEIGVAPQFIRVVHGDTDRSPYGWGTFASRSLVISGGATLIAARKVRAKLIKIASHMLEAAADDIVIESGACVTGGGARLAALIDLLRERSGIHVFSADDPLHAVIAGAARIVTGPGARTLWNDAA